LSRLVHENRNRSVVYSKAIVNIRPHDAFVPVVGPGKPEMGRWAKGVGMHVDHHPRSRRVRLVMKMRRPGERPALQERNVGTESVL